MVSEALDDNKHVILFAPNVNTGGGLVLLKGLLEAWPKKSPLIAVLDYRAKNDITLHSSIKPFWVHSTFISRLKAEKKLQRLCTLESLVFCFHGLPPLFKNKGRSVVFLQNRLLLERSSLSAYPMKTALRIWAERLLSRKFQSRVSQYIVQTNSMALDMKRWLKGGNNNITIKTLPFLDTLAEQGSAAPDNDLQKKWDFVYVADGVAHKNHKNLVAAWQLLQSRKLKLALTLGPRDQNLIDEIDQTVKKHNLEIHNVGHLSSHEVFELYRHSKALIFPSLIESFGLPLIEAKRLNIPILAPESDYVRDVCSPVETFDPKSPISIARAVNRFLGVSNPEISLKTSGQFWQALLRDT